MENKFASVDLHTHSTASDGTLSPAELARKAAEIGLCAIALTDHDTVSGIGEFTDECRKLNIEGIAGAEFGTEHENELHIVGLFIDVRNKELEEAMSFLRRCREERDIKMAKKLRDLGMSIEVGDIVAQKKGATLQNCGRPHIARAMLEKGYVSSINEAFELYLAKGKKCYVQRRLFSPEKSIEIVKKAGGIAVLAHPFTVSGDIEILEREIARLKTAGLDAMECYYSRHSREYMQKMLDICKKYDLLPSGGSDFHGANKPDVPLGQVCGGMYVPYEIVAAMKEKLA